MAEMEEHIAGEYQANMMESIRLFRDRSKLKWSLISTETLESRVSSSYAEFL